jgi:hypothetical protein
MVGHVSIGCPVAITFSNVVFPLSSTNTNASDNSHDQRNHVADKILQQLISSTGGRHGTASTWQAAPPHHPNNRSIHTPSTATRGRVLAPILQANQHHLHLLRIEQREQLRHDAAHRRQRFGPTQGTATGLTR